MAKTNLQLKSLEVGTEKKMTTTITYVNPDADSATLKEFGQKLNELTANTYVETNRIQTINVDTEDVPLNLKQGSLDVATTPSCYREGNAIIIRANQFTINGEQATTLTDKQILGYAKDNSGVFALLTVSSGVQIRTSNDSTSPPTGTYTFNFVLQGSETHTSAFLTKELNIQVS